MYKTIDLRNEKNIGTYFETFYRQSLFTWEGFVADKENLEAATEYLNLETPTYVIWKGGQMNDYYKLTGTNRYPDDLTFVGIKKYQNPIAKLIVGARWFDDIVDNNRWREEAK